MIKAENHEMTEAVKQEKIMDDTVMSKFTQLWFACFFNNKLTKS
jgi:hypothetical protein